MHLLHHYPCIGVKEGAELTALDSEYAGDLSLLPRGWILADQSAQDRRSWVHLRRWQTG